MASSIALRLCKSSNEFLLSMASSIGFLLCTESTIEFLILRKLQRIEKKTNNSQKNKNKMKGKKEKNLASCNIESLIQNSTGTHISLPFSLPYSSKFSNTVIIITISIKFFKKERNEKYCL